MPDNPDLEKGFDLMKDPHFLTTDRYPIGVGIELEDKEIGANLISGNRYSNRGEVLVAADQRIIDYHEIIKNTDFQCCWLASALTEIDK